MEQRYREDELIGVGGAGAVYKGFDLQLQREVAIKRLRDLSGTGIDGGDQATPEALLKEALTLCRLQHPNILTVYDAGLDHAGRPFVVMEYLRGEDLETVVRRGPLTAADFQVVAEHSLQALAAAHEEGILHRDIKPRNLMLVWISPDAFQVKLLDFGLAKFTGIPAEQTVDQGGAILGSIHYMAPEQFERRPLDAQTDLYSLGATFYFALTAAKPFDGPTGPEVMAAHLQHHLLPLAGLRPDLPLPLIQWLEELLKRNPEERPSSARQALLRLQSLRSANPSAGPIPPNRTSGGGVKVPAAFPDLPLEESEGSRPPWAAIMGGVVAVVVVGAGIIYSSTRTENPTGSPTTALAPPSASLPAGPAATELSPFETDRFPASLGKIVVVEGTVVRVGESKSGKTRYLNFSERRGQAMAIAFRSHGNTGPKYSLSQLADFNGKRIRITGTLEKLYDDWLIFVDEESQLQVVGPAAP
jgi:serine/threonine-protein kinase